ncbi:MAG TPA: hypothetical protein VMJ10_10415 [Kofleriaceae bacterium]|nr:hypothetical protein [Kofleriaceae bacterium]
MDPREATVRRLLDRYLVEIVEAYELCPWARAARLGGELAIAVLWGQPELDDWARAAERALAGPHTRVAMIVAPEWSGAPAELRALRDRVAARVATAGVADFHPDAALELATPAKLVPFLRRAPDPLLQLVPLALLDSVRASPAPPDLAAQARMLGGAEAPPRGTVADRIAAANHARVAADPDAIAARFAAIADDRARSYADVGINASRRPR